MGQATTVHPLLANFDRLGWLGGAWASRRERNRVGAIVASRAPKARYAWTIFKPDRDALEALAEGVRARKFALPVGIAVPFASAFTAFEHVSAGQPGRAVLLPQCHPFQDPPLHERRERIGDSFRVSHVRAEAVSGGDIARWSVATRSDQVLTFEPGDTTRRSRLCLAQMQGGVVRDSAPPGRADSPSGQALREGCARMR